jgi:hypothetical protein
VAFGVDAVSNKRKLTSIFQPIAFQELPAVPNSVGFGLS